MKNIIFKISKFISSRLLYLMIGIFLAIGATYVYATWDQAKTGGSSELGQSNWNALVTEVHNKCGTNCDATATAATASGNSLTESNWNNLADLLNNTLTNCTADNSGKCFVNDTLKSALDADLTAGNIKSGVDVFGITGNYSGASPSNCAADNGGACYISEASKSALDTDLIASNIKSGVNIFGVAGNLRLRCRHGTASTCYTDWCTFGTSCSGRCDYPPYIWLIETQLNSPYLYFHLVYNGAEYPAQSSAQQCEFF